jgi:hypothetical protein
MEPHAQRLANVVDVNGGPLQNDQVIESQLHLAQSENRAIEQNRLGSWERTWAQASSALIP